MKKESRKKYLLKNTIFFSIGNFGSKIINFFLVPLYTNILSVAEYGTVDLMTILTTVLVPIITLNLSEAVLRFSLDKDADREKILNIVTLVSMITALISIVMIPVLKIFEITSPYSLLLAMYILTFSISSILLCYMRGIEKLLDYSVISIIQTILIATLNIIFLTKFKIDGITKIPKMASSVITATNSINVNPFFIYGYKRVYSSIHSFIYYNNYFVFY